MEADALPLVMIADNFQQIREESEAGAIGDSLVLDEMQSTTEGNAAEAAEAREADGTGRGIRSDASSEDIGSGYSSSSEASIDWAARQISHFSTTRNAVSAFKEFSASTNMHQQQNANRSELPHNSDRQSWKRLCFGYDSKGSNSAGNSATHGSRSVGGRYPATSFVGGFSQSLVRLVRTRTF